MREESKGETEIITFGILGLGGGLDIGTYFIYFCIKLKYS